MNKYIDADRLRAEIERRRLSNRYIDTEGYENELLALIDSLQQEQPAVDLEKEMDNDYDSPLWEGEQVSWMTYTRNARHFYSLGLKAKKEELPEIGLDKFAEKIKTFQGRYKHSEFISIKGAMAFMARMFYQYPNTARQWYESLPKATMG